MSLSASDVSIVTVNWNGRSHLASLLPSLLPLGVAEIILVDNGSSDGSQEYVRQVFPQVRIIQNDTNRGFAHPNNVAAREAQGRYLALINNDMRAEPTWITAGLARLGGPVVCVASRILDWEGLKIDFNGSSLQYLGYALQKDIGKLAAEVSQEDRVLFACGGAMLVERDVFLKLGGFDEDFFAIFEDVDFGWRLWISGYEVAFAPDSLVYHRGHGTFQAHTSEKMRYLMHRNALFTIFKNYEDETFRRILPAAILMALKRAVLFSGVDKTSFYLWAGETNRLELGDPAARQQLLDSLNQLVALQDVLEHLPGISKKRAHIQSLRRRSDRELVAMFGDPMRAIVEDPEYQYFEAGLLDSLDLGSLFGTLPRVPERALVATLDEKINAMRRELTGLQWLGNQALSHPPAEESIGLWGRVRRTWRIGGIRAIWRQLMKRVSRGT